MGRNSICRFWPRQSRSPAVALPENLAEELPNTIPAFSPLTDVFFLDFPLHLCLEGAASRVGTVREDMPWLEKDFDSEFRQYILDFPKDQLPKIYELIEQYRDRRRIIIFHSREEADHWIASEQQVQCQKNVEVTQCPLHKR